MFVSVGKLCFCQNYSLKWYGRSKEKLAIISDDDNQNLNGKMRNLAARSESIDPKLCSQLEEEGNMAALPTTAMDENSINDDKVHSHCADLSSSLNDFKRQILEFAENRRKKDFIASNFDNDLVKQIPLGLYKIFDEPYDLLDFWRSYFLNVLDRHAPLIKRRVRNKTSGVV